MKELIEQFKDLPMVSKAVISIIGLMIVYGLLQVIGNMLG